MRAKHDENAKRKAKPPIPSTGCGAASAMDALIKRRVNAPPASDHLPPAQTKKH